MLELSAAFAFGVAVGLFGLRIVHRWRAFRRAIGSDLVFRSSRGPRGGRAWQIGRMPPGTLRAARFHSVSLVHLPSEALERTAMTRRVRTERERLDAGGRRFSHVGAAVDLGRIGIVKVDWHGIAQARRR